MTRESRLPKLLVINLRQHAFITRERPPCAPRVVGVQLHVAGVPLHTNGAIANPALQCDRRVSARGRDVFETAVVAINDIDRYGPV